MKRWMDFVLTVCSGKLYCTKQKDQKAFRSTCTPEQVSEHEHELLSFYNLAPDQKARQANILHLITHAHQQKLQTFVQAVILCVVLMVK